ncbi:MAG TPA: ATP-binding protein [Candidatus Acidoferrum sp.]|nr:ATP-binding protein [Candidatus Acidoferrum sp.]
MIFQSIRWRLQVWYGLVFLGLLAGFGVTAYSLLRNVQLRHLDEDFLRRMGPLSSAFRPPPGGPRGAGPPPGQSGRRGDRGGDFPGNGPPEEGMFPGPGAPGFQFRLPAEQAAMFGSESNSFYFVVWGREGKVLAQSEAAPHDVPRPEDSGGPQAGPASRTRGLFREFWHPAPGGEIVLVGRSIAEELAGLRLLAWELAGAGAIVLLLGLTGGWWVATRALRPIEDISATAVKIAAGDLSQRISTRETENELGRLAAVLNSTFARLEAAFAQQRQFTSDAAHELRTPITVMLTQTQTALQRERGAAEYRATVEACQRAAQRMRRLMESLLELARLDAGQETLQRRPFDLSKTVNECVELVKPLAEERGLKILCALPSLPCVGDPERMGQVITNLLDNAMEYNQQAGEVRLTGERPGGTLVLTVSNSGPGIAPEDLPRIFERFYRADKARSGSGGHAGLGLAISKAIVEAHGGTLEAASRPGQGAAFTLRLPAAG